MPVDLYVGGAEHAVLHLLYSRFWHKVLFDLKQVSTPEPFTKLVNQGMILGEVEITGYQDTSATGSARTMSRRRPKARMFASTTAAKCARFACHRNRHETRRKFCAGGRHQAFASIAARSKCRRAAAMW